MASKKRGAGDYDEDFKVGGESGDDGTDFFDVEVARYAATVDRDLGEAFQRYGFTLFHSLSGERQVELSEKLGLLRNDAVDSYNLGGAAAVREDYAGAAKHYQKALELDGTLADAAHNLALSLERLGRKPEAINAWSRFMELAHLDDDRRAVEAHLAELKA